MQHIDYAKSKSFATLKREDPNFVPPTAVHASPFVNGKDPNKRARDEDNVDTRQAKREKADESSDEEMEIDDEDEQPTQQAPPPPLTCTSPLPSTASQHRLHVSFAQSFHRAYDRAPSLLKITLHKSAARSHRGCTLRTVPAVRLLAIPPETC